MEKFRRVVFCSFLVFYLIGCPLTILYALGYLYRPGEPEGLVKTGLIYLSTAPSGATIYLNRKRFTEKTPAVLPGLLPGSYRIQLALKNHQPWTEVIPVEEEKATVLERVLMLPLAWSPEKVLAGPFNALVPLPESRLFILSEGSRLEDWVVYDDTWEEGRRLLPESSIYGKFSLLSHLMISKSPSFLARVRFEDDEKTLRIDPRRRQTRIEDLTDLLGDSFGNVEWSPQAEHSLFALSGSSLTRFDLVSKSVRKDFLKNLLGFGLYHKKIYLLDQNYRFERTDLEGEAPEVLFNDPEFSRSLFGSENYRIKVLSKDFILFLSEDGGLLTNRFPYRLTDKKVRGFALGPDEKRLLIWTEHDIGILDFSREDEKKEFFERGARLIWIFKKGHEIRQAWWVYEDSHILFQDDDQLFLIELETYQKPHLLPLVRVRPQTLAHYSEESGKLYFLGTEKGELLAVELVPRREIPPLSFPSRKEEKKKSEIVEL